MLRWVEAYAALLAAGALRVEPLLQPQQALGDCRAISLFQVRADMPFPAHLGHVACEGKHALDEG